MNIILIFTYGISLKNWEESGLLSREIKLYEELHKKYKYKFTFLTFGDDSDINVLKNYEFIDVIPAKSKLKFGSSKIINFLKSMYLPFKLKKSLNNIDLIKTNQLNGSWIGIILKLILNKPLFIRTGYDILQFKIIEKKPVYIIIFYYLLTQLAILFSDVFSVTSLADKSTIQKRFIGTREILLNRNYIFKVASKPYEKKYSDRIISVGRLEKQKNYIKLLNNLEESELQIDIVGEGIQKEIIDKTYNNKRLKVNFIGPFNNQELIEIYGKYKVFVSASMYEGNPKAILEAMSSGCMVVAFENKNIEEIIENNQNGFIFHDFKDLPNLLNKIINNKELFELISKNARETINQNYIFESAITREVDIYKSLLQNI